MNFTNAIVREVSWTTWKQLRSTKGFLHQVNDDGDSYVVYGYDLPEVIVCRIWKGTVPTSLVEGGLSQEANDSAKADFESNFLSTANRSLNPRSADGRPRIASEKTDRTKVTILSHDWTDPTTWAQGSTRVVSEVASGSSQTKFHLSHQNVIDTYHGKVTQECFLKDTNGNSYRVEVRVSGVLKTEQDPHYGSGGDFTVDYVSGTIDFLSPLSGSEEVTVTYHYASGSTFTFGPTAGKSLRVEFAEVQFSDDVIVNDTVVFQPYGHVDVFAPQLLQSNGGPLPSGSKIPLGDPVKYKTMTDYQNEAVKSYCTYPAIGGSGWRGSPRGIVVLDWDYVASTVLSSRAGMEVRISLEHDKKFDGWYATATFYCVAEDE